MINKYFLYKRILTNAFCTSQLDGSKDFMFLMQGIETPIESLYDERVETITQLTKSLFVEDLQGLSGEDVKTLFIQRDCIINNLKNKNYALMLIKNENMFKEVLESLFDLTLEHIENYEKAEVLIEGKRIVPVVIDNNNHNLMINGNRLVMKTEIENNTVTIEKCQDIISHLKSKFNYDAKELRFLLSVYTETENNELGDYPEELLLNLDVVYDVYENCITRLNN